MASEMESIREEAKESRRISSLIEDILNQVIPKIKIGGPRSGGFIINP